MNQLAPTRLERPLQQRKISGVCAAIANQQRIDVNVVRGVTLVLMAAGGIGFVAYFAGLLLIPAEGAPEPLIREGIDGPERNKVLILGIAAAIAIFGLGRGPFGLFGLFNGDAWPFFSLLALAAAIIIVMRHEQGGAPGAPSPAGASGPPTPSTDIVVAGEPSTAVTVVRAPPPSSEAPTAVMAPTEEPKYKRRWGRSILILGGSLLALAAAGSILAATGDGVRWDVALCASAIAIGVALVVSAPFGGARVLAPIGLLLAVLAGTAAAANLDLRGGVGDHLVHPSALRTTGNSYHLAAGRLMVDLKDVTLPPGELTTVHAEVGFGQLVVRVPAGVVVQVSGHASAGDVEMFGRDSNGLDAERSEIVDNHATGPTLQIDAHTGFGQVRVLSAGHALPKLGDHAKITNGESR